MNSDEIFIYSELDKVRDQLKFKNSDYQYNDYTVPRVSHILKSITPEYIVKWANSLGFKRISYNKRMQELADEGTIVHQNIDDYINGIDILHPSIGLQSFLLWLENIKEYQIISNEYRSVGKYFGGTVDLIIRINGKNYIIDFKTSKNITDKHFMQLSAYVILLENEGMQIDGIAILQLSKQTPGFNEFFIPFNDVEKFNLYQLARSNFLQLTLYYYYHMLYSDTFSEMMKR